MTIRLRVRDLSPDRVGIGFSPVLETLSSLHVLRTIENHPLHISWSLRARDRLTAELKAELAAYAFWHADAPLDLPPIGRPTGARSWDEDSAALRAAPVELVAEQLVHRCLVTGGRGRRVPLAEFRRSADLQRQAGERVEARHPSSAPVLRELIADPERARDRFTAFVSSFWHACLAPEWPELERPLRHELTRRRQVLSRHGPAATIAGISPRVRLDPADDSIEIRPPQRRSKGVDGPLDIVLRHTDRLVLLPSHFAWPKMSVALYADTSTGRAQRTVLLRYTLTEMQLEARAPEPPDDLIELLRAAGDPTRLRILQLLARRPRSTREIARLVGLTDAAISKHLKPLRDAGWVWTERRGHYLYNHLDREASGRLTQALDLLSEQPGTTAGN